MSITTKCTVWHTTHIGLETSTEHCCATRIVAAGTRTPRHAINQLNEPNELPST